MSRTAVAILSTENLLHNVRRIKELVGQAKIIAMVKANAYGHGLRSVSLRLDRHISMLGVASIDEAISLRKVGVKADILLLEGVFEPSELITASVEGFHVVFHNEEQIGWLEKFSCPLPLKAWVKLNTGMGRLGFSLQDADRFHLALSRHSRVVKPLRIISHFACAEDFDHELNEKQRLAFKTFVSSKEGEFSLCNSAGIFNFSDSYYDYVRPGIAIYGVSPLKHKTGEELGLKPVMTLQTSIIAAHNMLAGSSIGYGARYCCREDMLVGVVAFGYGDGYPATIEDGAPVLVNGKRCPIVGRVSMDMLTIDLRPCFGDVRVGDSVTLWGEGLPIEHVAECFSGSRWSMLTGVQNRVKFLWTAMSKDG